MKNHHSSEKSIRPSFKVQAGRHKLYLGPKTLLMGVINVTPDSFSHDGCLTQTKDPTKKAVSLALKQIQEGADIIDIGGESSRPGAHRVSTQEEIRRIIPVVEKLSKKINVPLSIDTHKSEVAVHALDAGAAIINNIKGCQPNKKLLRMVRDYDAAIVLMHMQGSPSTMQKRIRYNDLISEIKEGLQNSIEICLEIGIKSDKILIDPGIGFGKSVEHNLEILNHLDIFKVLKQPICIGTSRKSFIGKVLNKDVSDRLIGTISSVCVSIIRGAHIVRVHDIKAVKEAASLTDAIVAQATSKA